MLGTKREHFPSTSFTYRSKGWTREQVHSLHTAYKYRKYDNNLLKKKTCDSCVIFTQKFSSRLSETIAPCYLHSYSRTLVTFIYDTVYLINILSRARNRQTRLRFIEKSKRDVIRVYQPRSVKCNWKLSFFYRSMIVPNVSYNAFDCYFKALLLYLEKVPTLAGK